jgi:hypothetical protein
LIFQLFASNVDGWGPQTFQFPSMKRPPRASHAGSHMKMARRADELYRLRFKRMQQTTSKFLEACNCACSDLSVRLPSLPDLIAHNQQLAEECLKLAASRKHIKHAQRFLMQIQTDSWHVPFKWSTHNADTTTGKSVILCAPAGCTEECINNPCFGFTIACLTLHGLTETPAPRNHG